MKILGVHDGHSASAAFLEHGHLMACVQEERLSKVKNQGGFPAQAINEVLSIAGVRPKDVDAVAYSTVFFENPDLHNRDDVLRVFQSQFSPRRLSVRTLRGLAIAVAHKFFQVKNRERLPFARTQRARRLASCVQLGVTNAKQYAFDHHRSHAACLSYLMPADQPHLRVTSDGQGDALSGRVTYHPGPGDPRDLVAFGREDSLAELYSLATCILGFVPLEHEYKLMGMAPYASSETKVAALAATLVNLFQWERRNSIKWSRAPNCSTRKLARALERLFRFQRMDHVAAAVQCATEEVVVEWIKRLTSQTGCGRIGVAGGLFMNVKMNGRIEQLPEVQDLQVFPSCGDESLSLGSAALACQQYAETPRWSGHLFLGRDFSRQADIEKAIDLAVRNGVKVAAREMVPARVAELLADGIIVARFAGRAEFGARALGNRSILADPRRSDIVPEINDKIKCRDFWMPFAATILHEYGSDLLDTPRDYDSPFMMKTYRVRDAWRPKIKAAIHPKDGTCRPQLLKKETNPEYYDLIDAFRVLTGVPALLNTSLNLHGYPLVYTPHDAIDVFLRSDLQIILLDNILLEK